MSVYRCNHCDQFCDNDYSPCSADPKDPRELVCEDCAVEMGIV